MWADETTTSSRRNTSELPIYIALLNAGSCDQIHCIPYKSVFRGANNTSFISFTVGDAYKMHLLGYAPFRLPHSDDTLLKESINVSGIDVKKIASECHSTDEGKGLARRCNEYSETSRCFRG